MSGNLEKKSYLQILYLFLYVIYFILISNYVLHQQFLQLNFRLFQ